MLLKRIKKSIIYGYFNDARLLLERESNANQILIEEHLLREINTHELPLTIMCTLIKDDKYSFSFCNLLIEKGYKMNLTDANGLTALTYAIIFEKPHLIELFLRTFEFKLIDCYDCYKNSLFHYIYGIGNIEIATKIFDILDKYYQYNLKDLLNHKNIDGLSVSDLVNYTKHIQHSKEDNNLVNGLLTKINPKSFFLNSNPLFISSRIKNIYNSKLNLKHIVINDRISSIKNIPSIINREIFTVETLDDSPLNKNKNSKHEFQMDYLYKIKCFNRSKSVMLDTNLKIFRSKNNSSLDKSLYNSSSNFSNVSSSKKQILLQKRKDLTYQFKTQQENKKSIEGWKSEIGDLFEEYSTLSTSSYRAPMGYLVRDQTCLSIDKLNSTNLSHIDSISNPAGSRISSPIGSNVNIRNDDTLKKLTYQKTINLSNTRPPIQLIGSIKK